jgi:drug/metabolite transporter (DMT)-like permease
LLGGGIVAWPVVILGEYSHWETSPTLLALTFYQTVIICFASYVTWFWLLQRYLASRLGIISLLTPVLAVLLGALVLDEALTMQFLASTLLILAGIGVMMLSDIRSRRAKLASTGLS